MSLKFCVGVISGYFLYKHFTYCLSQKNVMPTSVKEPIKTLSLEEEKLIFQALNPHRLKFTPSDYRHKIFTPKDFKGFSGNYYEYMKDLSQFEKGK